MEIDAGRLEGARIFAARTEQEIARACELVRSTRPREIAEAHPEERGCVRLLEIEGKVLAACFFDPLPLRVRDAAVRCARIHEAQGADGRAIFRRTGSRDLFDLLYEEMLGYLWARGYPMAYAHGELTLFPQHGFVPCFYHPRVCVKTAAALRLPSPYRVRHLKSDDVRHIPALKALNRESKPVVYATGVPRFHHFCVETPAREIRGCFSLEADAEATWVPRVFVPEVEASDREAVWTILHHCARKAEEVQLDELSFPVAASHPVGRACIELGGYAAVRGAHTDPVKDEEMLCLLERRQLFADLALPAPASGGPIAVSTERGCWTLQAEEGRIGAAVEARPPPSAVRMPDWAFTQMIAGYRSVEEIDAPLPPSARDWLRTVFPKTWPYSMPDPDHWEPVPPRNTLSPAAATVAASLSLPWHASHPA